MQGTYLVYITISLPLIYSWTYHSYNFIECFVFLYFVFFFSVTVLQLNKFCLEFFHYFLLIGVPFHWFLHSMCLIKTVALLYLSLCVDSLYVLGLLLNRLSSYTVQVNSFSFIESGATWVLINLYLIIVFILCVVYLNWSGHPSVSSLRADLLSHGNKDFLCFISLMQDLF